MYIVLSWIQWSGKWTQARILEKKYNFEIFDTWAHIRELAKEDSELGREIKERIDAWNLVSIDILEKVVWEFIKNHDENSNIIFDWIPRSLEQKEFFDRVVKNFKIIYLNLSKEEWENRVLWRRICFSCQSTYSRTYEHKFCEKCWWKLWVRVDDSDDAALQKRIDIFFAQTVPVIESYRNDWKVIDIDAALEPEEVNKLIEKALNLEEIEKSRIREVTTSEKDLSELSKLYKIFGEWYEISSRNIGFIYNSPRDYLFAYEIDDKLVWTISLSMCLSAGKKPYMMIDNFCVDEKYRWIGIWKALLEKAENIAKAYWCYKMVLLSNKRHTEFHKTYVKFGLDSDIALGFKKYI